MSKNKNRTQQSQDRNEPQTPLENPTRDQPEGPRETPEPPKPQAPPERGGRGISNRGLDREEEQEGLPDRGSRQSERQPQAARPPVPS
jgi:hypothetical protein